MLAPGYGFERLTTIQLHPFPALSRNTFLSVDAPVYEEILLSGSIEPDGHSSIKELVEKERREARRKGEYYWPVIQEILVVNVDNSHA